MQHKGRYKSIEIIKTSERIQTGQRKRKRRIVKRSKGIHWNTGVNLSTGFNWDSRIRGDRIDHQNGNADLHYYELWTEPATNNKPQKQHRPILLFRDHLDTGYLYHRLPDNSDCRQGERPLRTGDTTAVQHYPLRWKTTDNQEGGRHQDGTLYQTTDQTAPQAT